MKNIVSVVESVKCQITVSISENLTDTDLESSINKIETMVTNYFECYGFTMLFKVKSEFCSCKSE